MKFCIFCGKQLNDDDQFCMFCGKPQGTQNKPAEQENNPTEKNAAQESVQSDNSQKAPQTQDGVVQDKPEENKDAQNSQAESNPVINGQSQNGQMPNSQNMQMNQTAQYNAQMNYAQMPYDQNMMNGQMPYNQNMMNGQMPYNQNMMNGQMPYGQNMMNGQMPYNQNMMNGQMPYGQNMQMNQAAQYNMQMQNGQMPYGQVQNPQMSGGTNKKNNVQKPPKKEKKQGGKKKKIIIISSIAAALLIACAVVFFLGFKKPTEKYLKDYFTGPDPSNENVAGVPEYYHLWYYIQHLTGESGVYCKITDVEIVKSEYSFFSGKASVILTTEDEYMTRKVYADLELSGIAGSWSIDKVELAPLDNKDNKIIALNEGFIKRVVEYNLGSNNKYGLDGYDKDRVLAFETNSVGRLSDDEIDYFTIKYDISNTTSEGVYDGYIVIYGGIDVDPDYRDTDYELDLSTDSVNVDFKLFDSNEPGNNTGNNDGNNTGNNDGNNTGNNTGNNDGNNTGNNTGSNDGNNSGNNTGNNGTENPIAGLPPITDDKIYLYSWNDEFGTLVEAFKKKYPEYSDLVEFVNLGMSGNSQDYFDAVLSRITHHTQPLSMVMYDGECASQLFDSRFISMDKLGVEQYYKDAYEYTKTDATFNGELKGMAPYVCPMGFIYRKDIAEQVLGTSDPAEVYKYIYTWDMFEDTAAKMKDNGYYMLSTKEDLARGYGGTIWEGTVPDACVQQADRFAANGYLAYSEESAWSAAWYEGFDSNVFGYFGGDWFVNYTMPDYTTKEWCFCPGPEYHHWGGAYAGVTETCPNKGLAALILVTICCDEDIQYDYAVKNHYTPNNRSAASKLISSGEISYDSNVMKTPMAEYNDEIAANTER